MKASDHIVSEDEDYQFGVLREHLDELGEDIAPLVERALDQIELWSDHTEIDAGTAATDSVAEDQRNGERLLAELAILINQWPEGPAEVSAGDENAASRQQFRIAIRLLIQKIESELRYRRQAEAFVPAAPRTVDWDVEQTPEPARVDFVVDQDTVRSVTFPYPEITAGRRDVTDPLRPRKVSADTEGEEAIWPSNPII